MCLSPSSWLLKPGFRMIATIASIAAQRSLGSLRLYGSRMLSDRCIRCHRCDRCDCNDKDRNISKSAMVAIVKSTCLRSLRFYCDLLETIDRKDHNDPCAKISTILAIVAIVRKPDLKLLVNRGWRDTCRSFLEMILESVHSRLSKLLAMAGSFQFTPRRGYFQVH